jgi:hypothetical protein
MPMTQTILRKLTCYYLCTIIIITIMLLLTFFLAAAVTGCLRSGWRLGGGFKDVARSESYPAPPPPPPREAVADLDTSLPLLPEGRGGRRTGGLENLAIPSPFRKNGCFDDPAGDWLATASSAFCLSSSA